MMRRLSVAVLAAAAIAVAGCAGNVVKMVTTNADMREQVIGAIAGNGDLAGEMIDRLMTAEGTQALVVNKVLANGPAVQAVMARIAKDPTMVDGVLDVAVQDSTMKAHVLTLFKGIQMGATRAR